MPKQREHDWDSKQGRLEYQRDYNRRNKEKVAATKKAWYEANKEAQIQKCMDRNKKKKLENPAWSLWYGALLRARRENLPFNIEESDIVIPSHCPIENIELKMNEGSIKGNSIVLDKIVPELGYVKGNIGVISSKANLQKSNMTIEKIERLYEYVSKRKI